MMSWQCFSDAQHGRIYISGILHTWKKQLNNKSYDTDAVATGSAFWAEITHRALTTPLMQSLVVIPEARRSADTVQVHAQTKLGTLYCFLFPFFFLPLP